MSKWLSLVMAVPIVGNIFGVFLLAVPEGYGVHRKLDRAGKTILGLLLVAFLFGVAAGLYLGATS